MRLKLPKRPRKWREAVDAAYAALALESARSYGLVVGGPTVNARRCEKILEDGKVLGYLPRPEAIETFIRELANPRPC